MYYLLFEMGVKAQVRHREYISLEVGDTVLLSRFSDGSYRLDQ